MTTSGSRRLDFLDGRSLDEDAAKSIRQQWLAQRMRRQHTEYVDSRQATVFVGTYNVNAKKLEGSLQDWLCPGQATGPAKSSPDVYAIGFQEIVDLNAMNVALDGSKSVKTSQFWMDKIRECLDSSGSDSYTLVGHRHLVGVLLCVYVKESLVQAGEVRDVRTASTAVGMMGMGNKGGVSVRLHVFDTSLCFVNSHLAAHRENVAGRNSDYLSIVEQSLFPPDPALAHGGDVGGGWVEKPLSGFRRTVHAPLRILDHDVVFWLVSVCASPSPHSLSGFVRATGYISISSSSPHTHPSPPSLTLSHPPTGGPQLPYRCPPVNAAGVPGHR